MVGHSLSLKPHKIINGTDPSSDVATVELVQVDELSANFFFKKEDGEE